MPENASRLLLFTDAMKFISLISAKPGQKLAGVCALKHDKTAEALEAKLVVYGFGTSDVVAVMSSIVVSLPTPRHRPPMPHPLCGTLEKPIAATGKASRIVKPIEVIVTVCRASLPHSR